MKARAYGFEWIIPPAITFDQFTKYLQDTTGKQVGKSRRYIFTGKRDDFVVGMVVTLKDPKRQCELTQENGDWVVKIRQIAAGKDPMEFNFFVIHATNHHGLYLHYHHSCAPRRFGKLCARKYRTLANKLRTRELRAVASGRGQQSREKAIKGKYYRGLKFSSIMKKDSFKKLAGKLVQYKRVELDFTLVSPDESLWRPVREQAKKRREILYFAESVKSADLIEPLVSAMDDDDEGIDDGKLIGEDRRGNEIALRYKGDVDVFHEYDYNQLVKDMDDFKLKEFVDSDIIGYLIEVAEDHPAIFVNPVRSTGSGGS